MFEDYKLHVKSIDEGCLVFYNSTWFRIRK